MNAADRSQVDEIKRALSEPRDVCERLGLADGAKRQAAGLLIRCPSHAERDPSCSVTRPPDGYGLRVKCFACDFSGDELHLVAKVRGLDITRDFGAVLTAAAEIAGVTLDHAPIAPRPHLRPVPQAPATDLAAFWDVLPPLSPQAWDYLRDRCLDDAATHCKSLADLDGPRPAEPDGHRPDEKGERKCGSAAKCAACRWEWARAGYQLAVALRDATGRVVSVQVRLIVPSTDRKDSRFRMVGSTTDGLFGDPAAVAGCRNVIVCEGMTDTLAALSGMRAMKSTAIVGFAGTRNLPALWTLAWAGRRVFIATDADTGKKANEVKGDEAAAEISRRVTAAGAMAIRLRPEGAKDLCAMREAGVDLRAWARGAVGKSIGFVSYADRITTERVQRVADGAAAMPFPVDYLNATLTAIRPRDVILLGAESGGGKTALATLIAKVISGTGKHVHYFALEPEPLEIERRIKFETVSLLAHAHRAPGVERLRWRPWHDGVSDVVEVAAPFEEQADRITAKRYRTLHTFYRSERDGSVSPTDFNRMARALDEETDLLILDHVHFFDDGDDPNREQKRIGRALRDLAIQTGKPLIIVAHLRKKPSGNRKEQRIVPEKDDFEGSSHIFKPVKKAIILAPARGKASTVAWHIPTYIAVVKSTVDGSVCRYTGLVDFNIRTNEYEPGFVLGELVKGGTEWQPVDAGAVPWWAKQ